MELIIWLVVVLLVLAAFLGLIKAILSLPPFADLQPYTGVIYALIVFLCVCYIAAAVMGAAPGWREFPFPRTR
jgi:hypothetical protein